MENQITYAVEQLRVLLIFPPELSDKKKKKRVKRMKVVEFKHRKAKKEALLSMELLLLGMEIPE